MNKPTKKIMLELMNLTDILNSKEIESYLNKEKIQDLIDLFQSEISDSLKRFLLSIKPDLQFKPSLDQNDLFVLSGIKTLNLKGNSRIESFRNLTGISKEKLVDKSIRIRFIEINRIISTLKKFNLLADEFDLKIDNLLSSFSNNLINENDLL